MGIFCFEGADLLVDRFNGCESIPFVEEELPASSPFVSTALKDAAASARECSLESSSGCGGVSFDGVKLAVVTGADLDEELPRMTGDCE